MIFYYQWSSVCISSLTPSDPVNINTNCLFPAYHERDIKRIWYLDNLELWKLSIWSECQSIRLASDKLQWNKLTWHALSFIHGMSNVEFVFIFVSGYVSGKDQLTACVEWVREQRQFQWLLKKSSLCFCNLENSLANCLAFVNKSGTSVFVFFLQLVQSWILLEAVEKPVF